jgi:7-hydroxymethyl chlorophyll a reductase
MQCQYLCMCPCRNYLHVMRHWGPQRAAQHIPEFAQRIVQQYDKDGAVSNRLKLKPDAIFKFK